MNQSVSLKKLGPLLAIVMFLSIPILLGFNNYYVHVASTLGLNLILLLGLNIAYGFGGQMNLAQAGFYSLGAYSTAVLMVNYHWSWWITLLPAVLIPVLFALIVGMPTVKLRHHNLAMATIALGMGIHTFLIQAGTVTGGPSGIVGISRPFFFGFELGSTTSYFYLISFFTIGAYLFSHNLLNSRTGRAMLAVRDDEAAARAIGIFPQKMKLLAFVISAGFAGVAGSLYAGLNLFVGPEAFSIDLSIILLAAIIVGGTGTNLGAVMGAIFITILPEFLQKYGEWELLFYGISIVLVILYFPRGIAGVVNKLYHFAAARLTSKSSSLKGVNEHTSGS
jgi:branched-chain amino acid transport system permease protein